MTDVTTRPAEPGSLSAAREPAAVNGTASMNGTAIGDVRAARHIVQAEQARLSADADIERRARAAQLELELREQRRAAARRDRQAADRGKQERVRQRRAHRAALRTALGRLADRAVFILPIVFPMAVAWVGQIRFAMTVMHWPLPAAVVFAAGFELSTAYVARLDWLSRAKGNSSLLFRSATWGFAAGAALMNYWHAAGPDFAPTGEAVSYGLMSVTGVVLWELLSTYRHRTSLRAEGKLPAARPRYGLARWIWFRSLTRLAWLLALRDSYPTTDLAWRAAVAAVETYGSPGAARRAVRAGRPVPRPELLDSRDERDDPEARHTVRRNELTGQHILDERDTDGDVDRDTGARTGNRDAEPKRPGLGLARRPGTGDDGSGVEAMPGSLPLVEAPTEPHTAGAGRAKDADDGDGAVGSDDGHAVPERANSRRQVARRRPTNDAAIARMKAYARERVASGTRVTGAELDREFGTRDYGRKVLRQLSAELPAGGDQHP